MSRRGIKKRKIYVPSLTKKRGLPPEKKNNASKKIAEKKEKTGGKQAKKTKEKGGLRKENRAISAGFRNSFLPLLQVGFSKIKGRFCTTLKNTFSSFLRYNFAVFSQSIWAKFSV